METLVRLEFQLTLKMFRTNRVLVFRYFFPCKRWLAVDEDDGQLARELVPVDEAFMRKGDEDEDDSEATLGLEQKGKNNY